MNSRNRVTACKRGDRRLLNKVFGLKPIKRGGKIPFQQLKEVTQTLKASIQANVFSNL